MERFDAAVVLTRVMASGVVMSIEKSDRELPGLERLLGKLTGRRHVALFNSSTAGLHAALAGNGVGHGDTAVLPDLEESERRFASWLGVEGAEGDAPLFERFRPDAETAGEIRSWAGERRADTLVLDLSELGFGPASAVCSNDEGVWARAERLKIFGAFDLRTMWTQEESNPDLVPGVQFNYRLSPLVAACLRLGLNQASKTPAGAAR